ncbi:MAG TPA: hypothetical protein VKR58_04385 [Aquella sp.]|nr:hypothetical protein [Aquella sp.]
MNKIYSIKNNTEMNDRTKKLFEIADKFGIDISKKTWQESFAYLEKNFIDTHIDSNEALSYISKILMIINTFFISNIKKEIVNKDNSGYGTEEILNTIIDGTKLFLGITEYKHDEIKKINICQE